MRLAPGSLTCADVSLMTGPAWAGAAQPAARQGPRTATRPAAAFLTVVDARSWSEVLALPEGWSFIEARLCPEARGPRQATADDRVGADFGVRADLGVPGMMTDLTYAQQQCSHAR